MFDIPLSHNASQMHGSLTPVRVVTLSYIQINTHLYLVFMFFVVGQKETNYSTCILKISCIPSQIQLEILLVSLKYSSKQIAKREHLKPGRVLL